MNRAPGMAVGATAAYTYAFRGTNLTLDDYLLSIETLPALGLHFFDLEILQPQHVAIYGNEANLAKLEAALKQHDVRIAGFTAWACLDFIHSTRPADHEKGYRLFADIARIAARLGASYIHLGSDMIQEYIVQRDQTYVSAPATKIVIPPEVSYRKLLDDYAARLARLAQIAHDHGLKFACEPRANSLIHSADSFLDVQRRAGHANLYCCLDVMHLAYHREHFPIAIEKLGDRLQVVQLCNAVPGELVHRPLSEGEIEMEPILHALKKTRFTGFLMLELYRGGKDEKPVVDRWYREGVRAIGEGARGGS